MRRRDGFTLIELLAVIAIIAIMASMLFPQIGKFQARSQSIVCMNNLRQIGIGVLTYVGEHDNTYPIIEPNPESPVYDPNKLSDVTAQPIYIELEPYGVTQQVLKCPADLKGHNYFAERTTTIDGKAYGTSYQWRVLVDDENMAAPKIYGGRRGAGVRIVKPSRVTICTDFEGVHGDNQNKMNRLYADGHVSRPY
jgi:prepilin-type N-terminal cleavage/methylation domain-containing protein/prepilin-type processing-associated H-X9-DG protein